MLGYVTIGANDSAAAFAFYDAVLATIGWAKHSEFPGWRGYGLGGRAEGQTVWICTPFDKQPATPGNGMMIAFSAKSHEEVDAFYTAALANGGTDEGAPGPRIYAPGWYSAYVRDPTGNKLAIVFNP